jgi:hypothetical protein
VFFQVVVCGLVAVVEGETMEFGKSVNLEILFPQILEMFFCALNQQLLLINLFLITHIKILFHQSESKVVLVNLIEISIIEFNCKHEITVYHYTVFAGEDILVQNLHVLEVDAD